MSLVFLLFQFYQYLNFQIAKKVIELEHRLHQLETELAQIRAEGSAAVEEVHRSYRRDLVPMDQSVVIYRREKR